MSKSLIKNVDGIGIWVRDDAIIHKTDWATIIILMVGFVGCIFGIILLSFNNFALISLNLILTIPLFMLTFMIFAVCNIICIECYEVYPGSDSGITILKTTDPAADQLAICRAAKEIESRCHEISAKRAELDRIAAGCK